MNNLMKLIVSSTVKSVVCTVACNIIDNVMRGKNGRAGYRTKNVYKMQKSKKS